MPLSPVIPSPRLPEHEVVRPEDLTVRSGSDAVHGTGLEVHEDSSGDEAAAAGLVVVDIDPLELELRVSMILSGGVNAVLCANNLPELGTDLVAALAALNMKDFSHLEEERSKC